MYLYIYIYIYIYLCMYICTYIYIYIYICIELVYVGLVPEVHELAVRRGPLALAQEARGLRMHEENRTQHIYIYIYIYLYTYTYTYIYIYIYMHTCMRRAAFCGSPRTASLGAKDCTPE